MRSLVSSKEPEPEPEPPLTRSTDEWEKIESESDLALYEIVLGDTPDTESEEGDE